MNRRTVPAVLVRPLTVFALALACGGATSGCAVRTGPAHTHRHCHLVEKWKGDRAPSHMRVCHSHAHRPDHH